METIYSLFLVLCLDGECFAEEMDYNQTLHNCQQQVNAWVEIVGRNDFFDVECSYNYFKFVESIE